MYLRISLFSKRYGGKKKKKRISAIHAKTYSISSSKINTDIQVSKMVKYMTVF